jgi:hypothetical protein
MYSVALAYFHFVAWDSNVVLHLEKIQKVLFYIRR